MHLKSKNETPISGENLKGGQLQESSKNLLEPLGVRYRIPREVPDRVLRTLGAGFLEVRLRGPNRVLRTLQKLKNIDLYHTK